MIGDEQFHKAKNKWDMTKNKTNNNKKHKNYNSKKSEADRLVVAWII